MRSGAAQPASSTPKKARAIPLHSIVFGDCNTAATGGSDDQQHQHMQVLCVGRQRARMYLGRTFAQDKATPKREEKTALLDFTVGMRQKQTVCLP